MKFDTKANLRYEIFINKVLENIKNEIVLFFEKYPEFDFWKILKMCLNFRYDKDYMAQMLFLICEGSFENDFLFYEVKCNNEDGLIGLIDKINNDYDCYSIFQELTWLIINKNGAHTLKDEIDMSIKLLKLFSIINQLEHRAFSQKHNDKTLKKNRRNHETFMLNEYAVTQLNTIEVV